MSEDGGDIIRVLIADDHAVFRRGLEQVLDTETDIDVVGEAEDGLAAIERTAELLPDVVLMDVRMPGATGIEAARRIRGAVRRLGADCAHRTVEGRPGRCVLRGSKEASECRESSFWPGSTGQGRPPLRVTYWSMS